MREQQIAQQVTKAAFLVVLGIDIGSTSTKGRGCEVVPQATGKPTYGALASVVFTTLGLITPENAFTDDELHRVQWDEWEALIGRRTASFDAKPHLGGDWYDDPLYLLYLVTGIGATLNALHAPEQVTVACLTIGFPAAHLAKGKAIADMLTKEEQAITVDGIAHRVAFERVEIVSQPQAAIASMLCHRNGGAYVADPEFVKQHVMLYDLGGRTGDRSTFSGSITKMPQGCEQDGLLHYLDEFKTGIFTLCGANVDDTPTLLQAWAEKSIWHKGTTHDLSVLVDDLAEKIVEKDVAPHLRMGLAALKPQPTLLLLAGGGVIHIAPFLTSALAEDFRHGISLTTGDNGQPNPKSAVVEGMLKWSVMKYEQALRGKA